MVYLKGEEDLEQGLPRFLRTMRLEEESFEKRKAAKDFMWSYGVYAMKVLGKYFPNQEDREDVFSNIMFKLLTKKINIHTNFREYFHSMMRKEALSYIRFATKREPYSISYIDNMNLTTNGIESSLELKMRREIFDNLLSQLRGPSVIKQFKMRLKGYKHPEIAKECGVDKGSSKSNCFSVTHREFKECFGYLIGL